MRVTAVNTPRPLGWPTRLKVPSHAHPIVRDLFREMIRTNVPAAQVSLCAGLGEHTVAGWKHSEPTLANLDAALNVLGLRLAILPLDEDES